MDLTQIIALLAALGGGTVIPTLFKGIRSRTAQGKRRRDEVDRAWRHADSEASARRRIAEHASHLRRLLYAAPCVETSSIPPWPDLPPTDTTTIKEQT